jgi:hypothetical protein
MKWKITNRQRRLYLIPAMILLVGLGDAVVIYLTAGNDSDGGSGYEIIGGQVFPVSPEDTKTYNHNVELYGGKMNLLAGDLSRWFAGLWHGRSLAFTVACMTLLISFGFFFVTKYLPSDLEPDARDENSRAGPDPGNGGPE